MQRKIFIFIISFFFMFLFGACAQDEPEQVSLEEQDIEKENDETKSDRIYVYVCGAVVNEGVYELPEGSRVYEAIEMAGGFSQQAAETYVNQAEILEDETQLYIPTVEELLKEQTENDGKVNLNTASKEELMTLSGVGEAKAESIIAYRETQGKFKSIEDIMQISGIKEGLFEKIKNYIKV